MRVEVVPLDGALVRRVAERMRACDLDECAALGVTDPAAIAAAVSASPVGAVAMAQGEPAAAWGGVPCWPGCWSVWFFATEQWRAVWRAAVRWFRRHIPVLMRALDIHRLQVFAMLGHPDAHRMLAAIGFQPEGVARRMGAGGQDFTLYGMVR